MQMDATLVTIIVAVLGALDFATLIIFFVNRHDSKKNLMGRLATLEKDVLRTQLLMLILIKPEEKQEIVTIAQHYFGDLHGDWYMTGIFNRWIEENSMARPEWFDKGD